MVTKIVIALILMCSHATAKPKPHGAVLMKYKDLICVQHPSVTAINGLRGINYVRTHKKQFDIKGRVKFLIV